MSFEDVREKLMGASKGSSIFILSEAEALSQKENIATKAYDLNRILSGSLWKGIPNKNLTFLVGPEASFKSSFMCLNLVEAQKKGYTPVILDAEQAWTPEFCTRWGLDIDKALIIPSCWVEDLMVELVRIIDTGVTKIALALDSIGALESRKMIDDGKKGDVKADQGTLQKKIKRLMKLMVGIVKMQDSFGFMSGHYYGDPSGYGDSEKIGGGFYPKLASDIIILLKKYNIYENPAGKTIKEKGKIIGTAIKAATNKNRNYPPFQEATVNIDYKKGIDPLAGIFEIAEEMDIIKGAGSWFSCELLDLRVQGRLNFYEQLLSMDYKPILDEIEETLKTTGYSTFVEDTVEEEPEEELLLEKEELDDIKEDIKVEDEKSQVEVKVMDKTVKKPAKQKRMVKK